MEFVYVLIMCEWEDTEIILSKEQAIETSLKHPNSRVEIFSKNNSGSYIPSYTYYKNGILH